MKKLLYTLGIPALMVLSSCDNGFEDMNVNPNASTEVVPGYLFTNAQLNTVSTNYSGGAYLTIGQSMQHFSTYKEVPAAGDKYFNFSYSQASWTAYSTPVIQLAQTMDKLSETPADVNKLAVARIWRVFLFHRLTDLYGDIPYTEAGKALSDLNYTPVYDSQADIYNDMHKELAEAVASFDATLPIFGNADLMYGGDITKWKKFAYSMMLRLGMRLTKVSPSLAESWVREAIAGGVITADADIATIGYVNATVTTSRNFIAAQLMATDYISPGGDNVEGGKFAKTIIDHMKATGDPRLNALAVVWKASGSTFSADTSTAAQAGMPNAVFNSLPANFNTFSEPNPNTILKYDAPYIVLGPAEMHLLLAEANVRGWYPSVPAATSYASAVTSGMKQWALFGAPGIISDSKINAYLAANPYVAGGMDEQIEQISVQKWVTLMIEDEYEIFANWRRTGYPVLTPTNYPGNLTGGRIPTRFVIPDSELLYNEANFVTARDRQSGNNTLLSTVWWDVD